MTSFDRICDEWHNVVADTMVPLLAADAPTPEPPPNWVQNLSTAFLVTSLLLILFFGILFMIAIQRRQRRNAEKKRREKPLADAWSVAGQRAQPYGDAPPPADAPPPSTDDAYGDDDDDVVPH